MKYDISAPLTRIREERRLTPKELATVLGFKSQYVWKLLRGVVSVGVKGAEGIAAKLNIPIEELIGFIPEHKTGHHGAENSGPIPLKDQAGEAWILRMLARNGGGRAYYENAERAWHDPDAAPVKGARRRGCHYITEATTAGGGQG